MPYSVGLRTGRRGLVSVSATTVAAADNTQVRAIKSQLKPDSVTGEGRRAGLSRGQAVAVGVSVVLGLVVFGYGMAGST
jgi:hypothetical protein